MYSIRRIPAVSAFVLDSTLTAFALLSTAFYPYDIPVKGVVAPPDNIVEDRAVDLSVIGQRMMPLAKGDDVIDVVYSPFRAGKDVVATNIYFWLAATTEGAAASVSKVDLILE